MAERFRAERANKLRSRNESPSETKNHLQISLFLAAELLPLLDCNLFAGGLERRRSNS